MNTFGQTVNGYFTGLVANVDDLLEKVFVYLLIPFIVFYLLKDMKSMHRGVLMLIPGAYRGRVSRILHDIDAALGQYIRGQLTVCFILGILTYIGYKIIGLPYAGVLAVFAGITDVIPYIGPFLGAAPAILIALTVSWKIAVLTIAINLLIQFLEGNVVSPLVVGKTLHLHPLLIILAVTVGGEVAGITGLIFAVPLVAVGKVIFQHTYHHIVRRPNLPD
jgi:predicted PurR-regulated permease PerM